MPTLATVPFSEYHAAPNLTMIFCPAYLAFSENALMPPSHRDRNFQGVVIYSFIRENGDELLHVRSRQWVDEKRFVCRCDIHTPRWSGKAWYNGEAVPVEVLNAVYAAAELEIDEVEPGRGMSLAEKGWDVLRYWGLQELGFR